MVAPWRHALKSLGVVFICQARTMLLIWRYVFLQWRYAGNAYPHTIDWGWSTVRYNRQALVALLMRGRSDCRYLEIGCDQNAMFDSVPLPLSQKVGVDPVSGGTHRMTSNEYFRTHLDERFDVIFIDGLHEYTQVRQDVMNAMVALKPGGWIMLHDMLPQNWYESHYPRISLGWAGDCWKVGFELVQTQGIEFKIINADCGLGLLRLTSAQPVLANCQDTLLGKQFAYFYEHRNELPIVSWDDAVTWVQRHTPDRLSETARG